MTTNTHNSTLRAAIVSEINRAKAAHEMQFGYCTWWFKLRIPFSTKVIRQELKRMERDGIVTADRSQSNNTKWRLTDYDNQ